ncbi:MAG TPA: acetylornithine transaminase [Alkalispirochaeta sp.]|nr:acetylornithine transaminase [Alkalispirochaeta sp.]
MTMPAITQDTPFARNYARNVPVLSRGNGVWLRDVAGSRYLDFGSGIAVNALGYGDRRLARVVAQQMKRLVHVSNLYATEPAIALANRLLEVTHGVGREPFTAVHFGNSGAEANESAIKYARLYAYQRRGEGHHRIISLSDGFHGRTMGALSATPNEAYRRKFEPLLPGFDTVPFDDPQALREAVDDTVAGVLVEVVQGEGGLRVLSPEMVTALHDVAERHDILLIADEIQTGLGRTGTLFGSTGAGLHPDVICLSKPLAGGLPMSATLIPDRVNRELNPGDHGTTFGGGPATSAAALYVLERITANGFLDAVEDRSQQLEAHLTALHERFDFVTELRGRGLLRGIRIELGHDQDELFPEILPTARDHGVLLLRSGKDVVRIAPPLVISRKELDEGVNRLTKTLQSIHTRRRL